MQTKAEMLQEETPETPPWTPPEKPRRTPPVVVSERFGAIRVSPHVYNTAADVDHLIDGLRDAIAAAGHAPPAAAPPPAADDFAFTPPEISCEEQMRRLAEMRSRL